VFCDVCNALHQKRAHPGPQKELFEEKDRSARKM
jgi:hypothetical protein